MNGLNNYLQDFTVKDLAVLVFLAGNAARDIKRHEISLPFTVAGAITGILAAFFIRDDRPLGILLSTAPGLVSLLLTLLTRGSIGAGDGIILLILGLCYPPEEIAGILFSALLLAAVMSAILLVRRHRGTEKFAFVPFFMAGFLIFRIL
ncbi:MAG TPA: prepilin peptidase [Lachnospiraceae bacterium]|nr:prepilin peptidase [Lachnospiraceae bacterium]